MIASRHHVRVIEDVAYFGFGESDRPVGPVDVPPDHTTISLISRSRSGS